MDLASPKPESSHRAAKSAKNTLEIGTPKCADHAALGHVLFIANSDVFRFKTYPQKAMFFFRFPCGTSTMILDPWIF